MARDAVVALCRRSVVRCLGRRFGALFCGPFRRCIERYPERYTERCTERYAERCTKRYTERLFVRVGSE